MGVILRLVLLFALASVLLMATEPQQVPRCCESESEMQLTQSQVKALVKKTEPIHAPCCADMLHISGTVILAISVDLQGNVTCAHVVSGDPLIVGVAMDSVRQWKFKPYNSSGTNKAFCGRVALRCQANERTVKYKVIYARPKPAQ
jgi:outer membrane biosynthesis protein TonB